MCEMQGLKRRRGLDNSSGVPGKRRKKETAEEPEVAEVSRRREEGLDARRRMVRRRARGERVVGVNRRIGEFAGVKVAGRGGWYIW